MRKKIGEYAVNNYNGYSLLLTNIFFLDIEERGRHEAGNVFLNELNFLHGFHA